MPSHNSIIIVCAWSLALFFGTATFLTIYFIDSMEVDASSSAPQIFLSAKRGYDAHLMFFAAAVRSWGGDSSSVTDVHDGARGGPKRGVSGEWGGQGDTLDTKAPKLPTQKVT